MEEVDLLYTMSLVNRLVLAPSSCTSVRLYILFPTTFAISGLGLESYYPARNPSSICHLTGGKYTKMLYILQ